VSETVAALYSISKSDNTFVIIYVINRYFIPRALCIQKRPPMTINMPDRHINTCSW